LRAMPSSEYVGARLRAMHLREVAGEHPDRRNALFRSG
jgi:hypothetical protein